MDAVTYPAEEVTEYVTENFVALRVDYTKETDLLRKYRVNWTPTIVFLDMRGDKHYRIPGYLPPEVFRTHMVLARAKTAFETSRYRDAFELYDRIARESPDSEEAPQAIYFRGVSRYKETEDASHLDSAGEELASRFPESEWTMRTRPW